MARVAFEAPHPGEALVIEEPMSIELDGFGGPQYIDYVVLHRANGRSQRIEVNRRLDARYGQLTIALGQRGARLRAISVYGSSPTRTGLQITGMLR